MLGKSLEGRDLAARDLDRVEEAGQGRFVIEQNGAATADTLWRASVLDRGDAEVLAKDLEEVLALLVFGAHFMTVEHKRKCRHEPILLEMP